MPKKSQRDDPLCLKEPFLTSKFKMSTEQKGGLSALFSFVRGVKVENF